MALYGVLERGHLSLANELGVMVGSRAANEDVVPLGRPVAQELSLLRADVPIVVREVQIYVGVHDQPVVTDHWNGALLGGRDDLACGLGAVRNNHKHLNALRKQRFRLLQLLRVIPFRGLHENIGAQLLGAFHEEVPVTLPSFLFPQRVHEEPYFRSGILFEPRTVVGR